MSALLVAPRGRRGGPDLLPSGATRGLRAGDFERIATAGFGDGRNAYAHSAAWFDGRLYVGTTRDNLCLVAARNPLRLRCWPVRCEDPPDPDGHRAEIWRYDPRDGRWARVYRAPLVTRDGEPAPRDIGYRGMATFAAAGDAREALYVGTWSATGARVLRSQDGDSFVELGEPGLGLPGTVCLRTLVAFRGRLYTSPVARAGRGPNEAESPVVLETTDPASGSWRAVSLPGFGDPNNVAVFELQVFDGHLYAGTINYATGFQLWKTRAEGRAPYRWTRVLAAGAFRGVTNETVVSLCPFGDALYVGTGICGGGYNRHQRIGPAAAELLRVYPDDTWELLVGEPRLTPDGLKVPLSGLGPGFDNFFNGYVWRMAVYEGWLYAGTYNWAVFLPYLFFDRFPEPLVRLVRERGGVAAAAEFGGGELWRSRDGVRWVPVTRDGFGTPFNFGIRTLVPTSTGLFAGTANPFGPLVAVERGGGWSYEANPRGGCEIWFAPAQRGPEQPRPAQTVLGRRSTRAALRVLYRRCERAVYGAATADWYEQSGFDQIGYWAAGARSPREACEALMALLVRPLGGQVPTAVLDVDCGAGGSTRWLVARYGATHVVGSGVRERAWTTLEHAYPGLRMQESEPEALEFGPGEFDAVISVERPGHFEDRRAFFAEACRVLRPGGWLLLADTLYTRTGEAADWLRSRRNYVSDLTGYAAQLERCGFVEVRVKNVTEATVSPHARAIARDFLAAYRGGRIDAATLNWVMSIVGRRLCLLRAYVVVEARRP